jgi:hypothetical protein
MNREIVDRITKNIYDKIIELSDVDLQRKLWLNKNNDTGLISSYVELMCSLFDDYCFNDYVDNIFYKIGFSEKCIVELKKLRDLLNDYDEKEYSDAEIINDLEWRKIIKQAKIVIKVWGQR